MMNKNITLRFYTEILTVRIYTSDSDKDLQNSFCIRLKNINSDFKLFFISSTTLKKPDCYFTRRNYVHKINLKC